MKKILLTTAIALTSIAATANAAETENYDPIEPVNRAIFEFNTVVDGVIIKPVTQIYRGVVPKWGRQRVTNVIYNLSEPVTVVNSTLQGDGENAFTSLWRFIINSTFGVLGIFDAASEVGLKARSEDFGQTLHVWGVEESPYVVLPILGPSSASDTVGLVADWYTNPFNYESVTSEGFVIGYTVMRGLDKRSNIMSATDELDRTSLDRYAAYKSAYIQNRKAAAENTVK